MQLSQSDTTGENQLQLSTTKVGVILNQPLNQGAVMQTRYDVAVLQLGDELQAAGRAANDCLLCEKRLCRTHLGEEWHECSKPESDWDAYSARYVATEGRQMATLSARIDGAKLCGRASEIRGGVPCTIDLSVKSLTAAIGGLNCHAPVIFDDGVTRLARFRLAKVSSPPVEARDYVVRSKVATIVFLRTQARVPVPEVFDWAAESDPENEVGTGYILMEKMEGKPLDWQQLTGEQEEKVVQQLADVFLELERHRFGRVGSIMSPESNNTRFEVQGIAHHSTFDMTEAGGQPLRPFDSSNRDGLLGGDIPGTPFPVLVPSTRSGKGDHIFVDESFNIVGIIDWEWTRTVSKEEAFASPCMMWPVGQFDEGSNELSDEEVRFANIYDERGRDDLAQCVVHGRKVQRFSFALGPASGASWGP